MSTNLRIALIEGALSEDLVYFQKNFWLPNSLKHVPPTNCCDSSWVCTNEKYVTCLRKMLPCPVFQDLFWFMVKSQHEWQSKYVVQSHRMLLQYFLSLFDLWLRHLNLINQKVSLLRYLCIWKMFYLFFGPWSWIYVLEMLVDM